MSEQTNPIQSPDIPELIKDLGDPRDLTRQRARLLLVHFSQQSLPALLGALHENNSHTRWEAVRALGQISNPETAGELSKMMLDDDTAVRWAAMESLVNLGHDCMGPMLELFVKNFDSAWLREGVHHVLHVFRDRNQLNDVELKLFDALSEQPLPGFVSSWTSEQVWAAEKVLERLDREAEKQQ